METTLPEWLVLVLPWFALAAIAGIAATAVGVWVLVHRLQHLDRAAARLQVLEDLRTTLLEAGRTVGEIDMRRIEHLLGELRDSQRRLADAVMDSVERRSGPDGSDDREAKSTYSLAERVVNRLLALGYRRIQVLDEREALAGLEEGEVRVEAYRDGVLCKGRVLVRDGQLADVEVRTAHSVFP